jgi:ubiquitin carboxyl-terminal hydrolase 8
MTDKLVLSGKIGLNNRGNTCFMNTTIQCLSHVIPLTDYIIANRFMGPLSQESKKAEIPTKLLKEFEVTKGYVQLIKMMWSSPHTPKVRGDAPGSLVSSAEREALDPKSFHMAFQRFHDRFEGYHQQDAEEALTVIMDSLHETLSYPVDITISGTEESELDRMMLESYRKWKEMNEKRYSVIRDIFTGQFVSQIICKEGEDKNQVLSRTYENFDRINLPIVGNTLYDCLYHYFHVELLEDKYHDEKGDRRVKAGKQMKIMMLPKYLIVVLKRFQNDGMRLVKKNTMVSFPIDDLDLSNYVMGYDRYSAMYKLRSIGCHIGSMNGGHYYAICRHRNEKWYSLNDRSVEEYNIKSEIPILQQRAYMLIYEKI